MNSERLHKAIQLAAKAHEGQKRKGKSPAPYIAHPVFVGMELLRLGYDEDTVIAGILHDTLEDGFHKLSRDEVRRDVRREFGDDVIGLIDAVTEPKDPNMTNEEKRRTWESRKEAYLKQLESASKEARAIACVDMWANILELKQTLKEEEADALKVFNVDIDKKLKHWKRELNLFVLDRDFPYARLTTEMENTLREIHEKVKEYEKSDTEETSGRRY
ncbi:MAG: HD domain-containing protein [Thermodesulfovibrionales bacterium]